MSSGLEARSLSCIWRGVLHNTRTLGSRHVVEQSGLGRRGTYIADFAEYRRAGGVPSVLMDCNIVVGLGNTFRAIGCEAPELRDTFRGVIRDRRQSSGLARS